MAKEPSAQSPRQWGTLPAREVIRRRYFPDVTLVTHEGKKVGSTKIWSRTSASC